MSIEFAPVAADKIRDQLQSWGAGQARIAQEVFDRIEALDDNPELGDQDNEGLMGGAFIYQFRIEMLPLVLKCTVAYDVEETGDHHTVRILDFAPRFVRT